MDIKTLQDQHRILCEQNLSLDMTRGKPSARQLDLAGAMLSMPGDGGFISEENVDTRNYGGSGGLQGLIETRRLFGGILGMPAEQVIVGGNASLTLFYDTLMRAGYFGVPDGPDDDSNRPWMNRSAGDPQPKFLCPTPGYDRHFGITESLGFELISVDMTGGGPDMDQVEALVKDDASVKGIWCVPKYSNPTGETYSDETVARLAEMSAAAKDFRIIWDNAYAEHDFADKPDVLANIYPIAKAAGNENRVLMFASTSKMTFAGSGLSAFAASPENVADALKRLSVQTIGPDKVNQLRHCRFFRDAAGVREHMQRIATLMRPKFDRVQTVLHEELDGTGIAHWTNPGGGYFVSLDTHDGCAKRTIALAGEAGVKMTKAGAPFPYGNDPRDRNIRIAPSFPPVEDVEQAMRVLCVCLKLAVAEKDV